MARVGSPVGQSGTGMSGKWRLLNLCKQACSCAALSLSLSLFELWSLPTFYDPH